MNKSTPRSYIKASPCNYADQTEAIAGGYNAPNAVACSGPALFMVHDRRRCRVVCSAHANWCASQSRAFGHSADCPFVQKRYRPSDVIRVKR